MHSDVARYYSGRELNNFCIESDPCNLGTLGANIYELQHQLDIFELFCVDLKILDRIALVGCPNHRINS